MPLEERAKVEMQKILILKTKEIEKTKRENFDIKEGKKYQDDYEVSDKIY